MNETAKQRFETSVLALVGGVALVNAIWMILDPLGWYEDIPAGVPNYGPFNVHFVRDFGISYLTMASGLLYVAWRQRYRVPVTLLAAVFFGLHAAVHVFDTARGHVPPSHWLLDVPTTYLPVLLLVLVILSYRSRTGLASGG